MTPYYDEDGITIYHGDCREVLPGLSEHVDSVLSDPPYPDYHEELYAFDDELIAVFDRQPLNLIPQLVFWSAKADFPSTFSAVHIWDKKVGAASQYERIFERNTTTSAFKVYRHYLINSTVAASYGGDVFNEHPSQKPIRLMRELADCLPGVVIDPFMGSGTTLRAAKDLGRRAIGIEVEERYCEIAVERLAQQVLAL